MDIINKLTDIVNPYLDKIENAMDTKDSTNILICVYIIAFLFIKPYKATELCKMPIIQLTIIATILYTARTNHITAALLTIAFLITILSNEESNYSRNISDMPIENREKFVDGDGIDEFTSKKEGKNDDESESESDEDDDEEDDDSEDTDDESDSESESDSGSEDDLNISSKHKAKSKKIAKKPIKKSKKNP